MAKDVWHRVDSGSFDKDGNEYKYVVEQNKNKVINTGSKNVRMRVIKEKPVVRRIRTLFDPSITVMGDVGAVAPSFMGFDMKRLKPSIFTFIIFNYMIVMVIDIFFFDGVMTDAFIRLTSFGPKLSPLVAGILIKILTLGAVLFIVYIPFMYRFFQKWKLYKRLKKEGIDYIDMHGMTGN